MTLWLAMAALGAMAALWLTRPLWQRREPVGLTRKTANVAAYSSRLQELKADIEAGVLPADEAAAIRQEMDARLLADAGAPVQSPRSGGSHQPGIALGLALLLPLFAGVWYWQAGSWRTAQVIATAPASSGVPSEADIQAMVTKLALRLQSQPDDAEGWSMLGRSYFVMNRHEDSAKAYGKANELSRSSHADWLVNEGEALALARDRDLLGRPAQLFEAALGLDPGYGKALWYGSLADAQAGNFPRASQRLQQLLGQELPDDLKAMVAGRLDELRVQAGGSASLAPPTAASLPVSAVATGGTRLTVEIRLAPALAKQWPDNATLFVFAKAAPGNGSAPQMPLAVQKLPAARLPLSVTLDDTMAMTPAMTLSQFDRYTVTARLSRSGGALAESGDLEGSVTVTRAQAEKTVLLTITRAVP